MMKLMLHLMPCESGKLYFETVNGKIEIDAGTRNVFSYVPQGNMIMSERFGRTLPFVIMISEKKRYEKQRKLRVYGIILRHFRKAWRRF